MVPSEIAIVVELDRRPAAGPDPSRTFSAELPQDAIVQGITSVHVLTTATSGRSRSASVRPVPFNIARAGARDGPFFSASLRTGDLALLSDGSSS